MDEKDKIKYHRAIERLESARAVIRGVDELVDGTIPLFSDKQKEWDDMLQNYDSCDHFLSLTIKRLYNLMAD
jgi:hypothetical protein